MAYRRFAPFAAALSLSMVILVGACSADATSTPTPSVFEADAVPLAEGWYVETTGQTPDVTVFEFAGTRVSETHSGYVSSEKIPAWTWVVPRKTMAAYLALNFE